jgi:hypothetical protein
MNSMVLLALPIAVTVAPPAVFVLKRVGFGYTINFGNRLTWLIVGSLLAGIFALKAVLRYTPQSGDWRRISPLLRNFVACPRFALRSPLLRGSCASLHLLPQPRI